MIFLCQLARGQTKVVFSPNEDVRIEILQKINEAKCSLDIAMYSFSDAKIWAALNAASERGIDVRLLLNKSNFKNSYSNCSKCDKLLKSGSKIRFHTLTMHHKFALVDAKCANRDPVLLTGSGNWSTSSIFSYDEDLLVYDSDAANFENAFSSFEAEFGFIWDYSRSFPGKIQNPEGLVEPQFHKHFIFTSHNMRPKFYKDRWIFSLKNRTTQGVAANRLIAAIDEAKTEIQIATAHFRRSDIYDALERASERGVRITLITDGQEFSYLPHGGCSKKNMRDKNLDECLENKKIGSVFYKFYSIVWNYKTAKQMHAKYMIVDRNLVLTGSYNWSNTAELKNLENLVSVDSPPIVSEYVKHFDKLLSYGSGHLKTLMGRINNYQGKGPCNFEPLTLSSKQIKKIRSMVQRGYCK